MSREKIIIDAGESPLGRVASYAAKQSLLGKEIIIINCNNSVVSGRKKMVFGEYLIARVRGGSSLKGPHFPKSPERIMKRTVRGMLSYKQGRGREALKRVMCYNDVPSEFEKSNKISLKKELKTSYLSLGELSKIL
ncbi:MAG: 50S ribosomal protein L13 [Nanoarchaeota archaeon]